MPSFIARCHTLRVNSSKPTENILQEKLVPRLEHAVLCLVTEINSLFAAIIIFGGVVVDNST